jgi:hypothetical protein
MCQIRCRKWKDLIVFVVITIVAGCAPNAVLTAASVPNPVLLGGPSHIKLGKIYVDVEIKQFYSGNVTVIGNSSYATEQRIEEGANKASAAILRSTQGNDVLDVHVASMKVGALVSGAPFFMGVQENWVNIKCGIVNSGKDKK